MFRDVAIFKPTIMVLVPALAEMALTLSRQFGRNMWGEELKTIICGAAPVAPYLITEYDKMGILLLPGYGLTESANLVSGNPEALKKPDSVGLIYGGMEYKIVDGELWLKGDNMMDGYVSSEDNAAAYEDGYFKTGDYGKLDKNGILYITGRKKNLIILSNGKNVYPEEIENDLIATPGLLDVIVYEGKSRRGMEYNAIVAEIFPDKDFMDKNGITDVKAYLEGYIAEYNKTAVSYKKITVLKVRDEDFPKNTLRKIMRFKLDMTID
jgi:long-chain acyl-CoA synthetase